MVSSVKNKNKTVDKNKVVQKKKVKPKKKKKPIIVNDDFCKSTNLDQIVLNFTDDELSDIRILNMIISTRNRKPMSIPVTSKIIFKQGLRHYQYLIKSYKERKGWS